MGGYAQSMGDVLKNLEYHERTCKILYLLILLISREPVGSGLTRLLPACPRLCAMKRKCERRMSILLINNVIIAPSFLLEFGRLG